MTSVTYDPVAKSVGGDIVLVWFCELVRASCVRSALHKDTVQTTITPEH